MTISNRAAETKGWRVFTRADNDNLLLRPSLWSEGSLLVGSGVNVHRIQGVIRIV